MSLHKKWHVTFRGETWLKSKTSVSPGQPSMLCLRFCFVLCRPWFPIFNPCYVINFKLEFLRTDRSKCLETWYKYCILPNLRNLLLQFLEKMSLLKDACLGLEFPFLALAIITFGWNFSALVWCQAMTLGMNTSFCLLQRFFHSNLHFDLNSKYTFTT